MSEENTNLPPKVNPLGDKPADEASKVKPVLRKPVIGVRPAASAMPKPPAPPAPPAQPAADVAEKSAVEQLKKITQNLKSITAPIPQQAILRNTGIIGSLEMTEAQKAAAKARTSRIALSEAIGAASVKEESAPIKTIKIQRPKVVPRKPVVPAAASAAPAEAKSEPTADTQETVSITQKKTLKVARPGVSPTRPKFGIKKPGTTVKVSSPAAKAAETKPAAAEGDVPELEPVGDIPDISAVPMTSQALPPDVIPAVPKGVAIAGVILQVAACAVIGVLAYFLYQDTQLPLFCGGCTP